MLQRHLMRVLLGAGLTGLFAMSLVHAQSGRLRLDAPAPTGCACIAQRVECLFGIDKGCEIAGCPNGCQCDTASCSFGFPTGSSCYCVN